MRRGVTSSNGAGSTCLGRAKGWRHGSHETRDSLGVGVWSSWQHGAWCGSGAFGVGRSYAISTGHAHRGSGLASRDGKPLDWFEITGQDGQFVKAQARIDGDTVVVWNDDVAEPSDVRFGWHQEAEPNLMNAEGLPAQYIRLSIR